MSILYAISIVYIAGEYCGPGFLLVVKKRPKKRKEELNQEDRQIDRQIDRQMDEEMKTEDI